MLDRWDGPFDRGSVTNFLVRMREGAKVDLYHTVRGSDLEAPHHLGWLQKERGGRFAAGGFAEPSLQQRILGDFLTREEAVQAFMSAQPEYAVHNSQWQPGWRLGPVKEVRPELREWVQKLVEDPGSGANRSLERKKIDYWRGSMYPWGLAGVILRALGYEDPPRGVCEQLAPTVEEAFEVFKQERPDLEPW